MAATPPELPREYVDTAYAAPSGSVLSVGSGGDLQGALNAANPGDVVELAAGATFTGNFVLPVKGGASYIHVRGASDPGALGVRASPSRAADFAWPKIVTPNDTAALRTVDGSHHWRLIGLDLTVASGVSYVFEILGFGGQQTTLGAAPHHLIADRCYAHGRTTGDVQRVISLNCLHAAVIDSYVSEGHMVGVDAQAIIGTNGAGPFKIVNNYLSATTENVMFGGGDPQTPNLVASDIEFRNNHCFKPLTWAGAGWVIKNLLELKNAQRVLIDGNVFENNWVHGQAGHAIVLTPRNQSGTAPWSVVQDITFTNNLIRNSFSGINVLGTDTDATSQPMHRVRIADNYFEGLSQASGSMILQIAHGAESFVFDHNTGFPGYLTFSAYGPLTMENFEWTNNIVGLGSHGYSGDNYGSGSSATDHYFPGGLFANNVVVGSTSGAPYPSGTLVEATKNDVGFEDWPNNRYWLLSASDYHGLASDGTDLGKRFTGAERAMIANQIRFIVRR